MDTLKPNMYVRTDEGIRKILREYDKGFELNRSLHYLYPEGHDLYKEDLEELEIKASYNIIDILEVGDIIRYRIDKVPLETKDYLTGVIDIADEEMIESIKEDKNYHVLQILTKEQFKEMSYEVVEKNKII